MTAHRPRQGIARHALDTSSKIGSGSFWVRWFGVDAIDGRPEFFDDVGMHGMSGIGQQIQNLDLAGDGVSCFARAFHSPDISGRSEVIHHGLQVRIGEDMADCDQVQDQTFFHVDRSVQHFGHAFCGRTVNVLGDFTQDVLQGNLVFHSIHRLSVRKNASARCLAFARNRRIVILASCMS
jgi:hypothetical protein